MAVLEREVADTAARVDALEMLCAEMYQVAGELGAPVCVLDQLWAAAQGEPLPHGSLLPFSLEQANPSKAAAVMGSHGGKVITKAKIRAAIRNGRLGGRPRLPANRTAARKK